MKRLKTNYPGVIYREADRIGGKDKEKVYYIVFKKDGKVLEEKVGRQHADDMTPARGRHSGGPHRGEAAVPEPAPELPLVESKHSETKNSHTAGRCAAPIAELGLCREAADRPYARGAAGSEAGPSSAVTRKHSGRENFNDSIAFAGYLGVRHMGKLTFAGTEPTVI